MSFFIWAHPSSASITPTMGPPGPPFFYNLKIQIMKSCNFILTINNPTIDVHQFIELVKAKGFKYGRVQLERGEQGTLHLQGCLGGKSTRISAVKSMFPTAHIETAKSPFHSWEYCGKADTRVEGPVEFGLPPANRARAGDYKSVN